MLKKIIHNFIIGAMFILSLALPPGRVLAASNSWTVKAASVQSRWNTDFSSSSFQQSLNNLKSTNANYVTLIYPFYQSNGGSTDIQNGSDTPTDASLIAGIQYAHS